MTTTIPQLNKFAAWQALEAHYPKVRELHLRKLFADDPKRGERMTADAVGIYFDYSKHRITDETLKLLLQLAEESNLRARIDAMFEAGLLEEVRGLMSRGYGPEVPAMSAIGYRECLRVINGEITADEAKAAMRRATRIYVRRQANWFKQADPDIRWFNAAEPGVDEAIASFVREALHE